MTQKRDGKSESTSPKRAIPLSRGKKFLFATVSTLIFFGVCEASLYLFGVQPVLVESDPFVGFAKHLPLFVENPEDANRMVTAPNKQPWFNVQEFARKKPANTYRIFCLGGSTTYGRPYDDTTSFCGWLRELLPAASSSQNWEVINAGGISYASYRVALVLEEIVSFQPDLIIVYTGHNEFLEHRTYDDAKQRSAMTQRLHSVFGRSRTYAVMDWMFDRVKSNDRSSSAVPGSATNLLPAEVATKLDKGVGPDAYTRDDKLRDQIVDHFKLNLRRIANLARSAGAEVVLVTPASNLRSCSPFKSDLHAAAKRDQFNVAFQQAQRFLEQSNANEALVAIDRSLQLDERYAAAHYLRGRILEQLQRYEDAKRSYVRARDEDVCPLRALSAMRSVVLEVAREQRVPVVDFEQLVEANSPQGISGDNLFLDHVHPTIEGHRILALSIADQLIDRGIVKPGADWNDAKIVSVTQKVEGRVDREANGVALRNLAKVLAWAGKQQEADRLALQAAELLADDTNAQYLAGSALIEQGDYDAAISKLQRVVRADPSHAMAVLSLGAAYQMKGMLGEAEQQFRRVLEIDPSNVAALNNLGALCIRTLRWEAAREHLTNAIDANPRYAKAFHNLGIVHSKQKRPTEALENLREAVEIDPDFWKAHEDLGNLYRARGSIREAISHYRQALRANPTLLKTANSLAWLLATTRDNALRNGEEALRWALRCGEGTNYRNPGVFNTLAAAYAETGDFDKAVQWQAKALASAPERMKPMCRERLELYGKRRALRQ